jgi:hypothetical protein
MSERPPIAETKTEYIAATVIVLGLMIAFGRPVLFGSLEIAAMTFSSPPFATAAGLAAASSLILLVVRRINRQSAKRHAPNPDAPAESN